MKRPEKARKGWIYLVRHRSTGLYKIGITLDIQRRRRQLKIGTTNIEIISKFVCLPGFLEKDLHKKYLSKRLPQSEYFKLTRKNKQEIIAIIARRSSFISPNLNFIRYVCQSFFLRWLFGVSIGCAVVKLMTLSLLIVAFEILNIRSMNCWHEFLAINDMQKEFTSYAVAMPNTWRGDFIMSCLSR